MHHSAALCKVTHAQMQIQIQIHMQRQIRRQQKPRLRRAVIHSLTAFPLRTAARLGPTFARGLPAFWPSILLQVRDSRPDASTRVSPWFPHLSSAHGRPCPVFSIIPAHLFYCQGLLTRKIRGKEEKVLLSRRSVWPRIADRKKDERPEGR